MAREIELSGFIFVEMGPESPEQYDVFYKGQQVGYVRYRFGNLTVEYPDAGMERAFERELDHQTGQMTDIERGRWLPVIARKLRARAVADVEP